MSFFWQNANFFYFLYFFFWLSQWSKFIGYFISNQISSCFCNFLRQFFYPLFLFLCSIHYFFTIFISKFSSKWQKAVSFNEFSKFRFCWISHFYKSYPIIIAKLTLYSISSVLLTWPVNQTSTKKNSVLIVFVIIKECGEIFKLSELFVWNRSKQNFWSVLIIIFDQITMH